MRKAKVVENAEIARASRWLVLQPLDAEPLSYEPGNVLSLFVTAPDGRRMRHAYTITDCDPKANTFTLLYRVIPSGHMTPVLEALQAGDEAGFDGKAHNPIEHEVSPDPKGIVGISTGTGIGPLYGFAKKVLGEGLQLPLRLYAGFREEADICLKGELDALAGKFQNFKWQATLSQPGAGWSGLKGRVTQSIPPLLKPWDGLHFHLVGNGQMLMEYYEALQRAGVPEARLSSETYFNWDADFDSKAVDVMLAHLV